LTLSANKSTTMTREQTNIVVDRLKYQAKVANEVAETYEVGNLVKEAAEWKADATAYTLAAEALRAYPDLVEALENYAKVMERFTETLPEELIVDIISVAVVQDAHIKAKEALSNKNLLP
jgi:hypothetical protein